MSKIRGGLRRAWGKVIRLIPLSSFGGAGEASQTNSKKGLVRSVGLRVLQKLRSICSAKAKMLNQRDEEIKKLRERTEKQESTIIKLKERNQRIDVFAQFYRENMPVNRYLRFARVALEHSADLIADCHVCHGLEVTPAAAGVVRAVGGALVADVVEAPSYFDRVVSSTWHTTNIQLLDVAFEGYARRCDGLLTVGWALKKEIEPLSDAITVIPNYRYKEQLVRSNVLRERCGLKGGDKLLLSISAIASGLENVLRALVLLPSNVHFASMGRFVPAEYEYEIKNLIDELGIAERVHLFDQVPYSELTSMASGADAGLIFYVPSVLNNRVSLPNRVFDYIASGLPFCCPDFPDISKIVRENEVGEVLVDLSPSSWANAIGDVLRESHRMKKNVDVLRDKLTWESLESDLFQSLGRPSSVVFYGFNDVRKNNRTMRMAGSMVKKGCDVKVFTYGDPSIPNPNVSGVKFCVIEEKRN